MATYSLNSPATIALDRHTEQKSLHASISTTMDPIDAIITWVDGGDPAHRKKRAEAARKPGTTRNAIAAGLDQTRFENNNEIEYCIKSIRKFAPWIRNIFLVTDNQTPSFLSASEKLHLNVTRIDHRDIFENYEHVLPTFNSLSIETVMHRIPGLANRYIYFNDDFMLLAPTEERDFFTKQGVVLRGTMKRLRTISQFELGVTKIANSILKNIFGINRAMSIAQQMTGAHLSGIQRHYFRSAHTPYPAIKETLENFFTSHNDQLANNISHRFRTTKQFATTSLSNHIEILNNNAQLIDADDSIMICFNRDSRKSIQSKIKLARSSNVKFLCIQSFEQAPGDLKLQITDILNTRIFDQ